MSTWEDPGWRGSGSPLILLQSPWPPPDNFQMLCPLRSHEGSEWDNLPKWAYLLQPCYQELERVQHSPSIRPRVQPVGSWDRASWNPRLSICTGLQALFASVVLFYLSASSSPFFFHNLCHLLPSTSTYVSPYTTQVIITMKLSAAIISALAAVSLAAPAPASRKPSQLARRSRLNRHSLLQHKSRAKGFSASGAQDSSSGFGGDSQGTPTGAAGGSSPTGTSSGAFGSSGSGSGFGASPSGSFGSGSDSSFGASPSGSFGSGSDSSFGASPSGSFGSSGSDSSAGASPSGSFGSSGSDSSAGASPSGSFGSSGSSGSGSGSSGSGSSGFGGQSSATAAASVPSSTSVATQVDSTSNTDDEYNENWAGVVVQGDEGSVTGVSASFALPTIKRATSGVQADATTHTASQWIGIDGYSCGTGLWQAGVDGNIDEAGTVSFSAWYEWYPAGTIVVELGDLAAGDVSIQVSFPLSAK